MLPKYLIYYCKGYLIKAEVVIHFKSALTNVLSCVPHREFTKHTMNSLLESIKFSHLKKKIYTE